MLKLLLFMVIVQVALSLIVRPLIWWYFGINRAIRRLEDIDASLRCLPAVREARYRARRAS
jgi:hypothetical protein